MSAKIDVLKVLEENIGATISGEQIAKSLLISRSAVWKAVNLLKNDGYVIKSTTNKGYSLATDTDIISPQGILPYLNENRKQINIIVHEKVDSTNNTAKQLALDGATHGTTVIAKEQNAGKGRQGKSFFSPRNTGIYMSMIIKINIPIEKSILITTAASVAICRAINIISPQLKPAIKWVNDIYIDGKKVCGILTEAITSCESGTIDNIILGIGINFNIPQENFPEELRHKAVSLFTETEVNKNRLIAEIINQLFLLLDEFETPDFMQEYRNLSVVLGKKIQVITPINQFEATAVDIDKNGGLIVLYENGKRLVLTSGEISILGDFNN